MELDPDPAVNIPDPDLTGSDLPAQEEKKTHLIPSSFSSWSACFPLLFQIFKFYLFISC
jgi:hypothetical protein